MQTPAQGSGDRGNIARYRIQAFGRWVAALRLAFSHPQTRLPLPLPIPHHFPDCSFPQNLKTSLKATCFGEVLLLETIANDNAKTTP